jgi:hypothetical protein
MAIGLPAAQRTRADAGAAAGRPESSTCRKRDRGSQPGLQLLFGRDLAHLGILGEQGWLRPPADPARRACAPAKRLIRKMGGSRSAPLLTLLYALARWSRQPVPAARRFRRASFDRGRSRLLSRGYRWFESISLQRRVACEPDFRGASRGAAAGAASEAIIGIRTRIRPFRPAPRGLIICPAERQPKLRRFFAYLADGAAEECRRLRRGVAGFDALAQVNGIHLGPFPAGVGSFHPPGSLVTLGRLKPQCNVYASARPLLAASPRLRGSPGRRRRARRSAGMLS